MPSSSYCVQDASNTISKHEWSTSAVKKTVELEKIFKRMG